MALKMLGLGEMGLVGAVENPVEAKEVCKETGTETVEVVIAVAVVELE